MRRLWSLALLMCACAVATPCASEEPKSDTHKESPVASADDVRRRFIHGAFALVDGNGVLLGKRWVSGDEPQPLAAASVVESLAGHRLSDQDAAALWEMLAGDSHAPFVTLPLLKSAVAATVSPRAREAMWGELAALVDRVNRDYSDPMRAASLIGQFERYRATLLSLLTQVDETVGGGDEMVKLMVSSRILGADLDESVAFLSELNPAAVDRKLDRERSAGRLVTWESVAAERLKAWRATRLASATTATRPLSKDEIRHRFIHNAFTLYDSSGTLLGTRWIGNADPLPLPEAAIIEALSGHHLSVDDAAALWEMLAAQVHAPMVTLNLVKTIIAATGAPRSRAAMWSELSSLASRLPNGERDAARAVSLIGLLERHRSEILPLFSEIRETEGGGDEMVKLMLASRIFGANLQEGLAFVTAQNPAAIARKIERERSLGKPVAWERAAYDLLIKWKNARLVPGAHQAPSSLAALDVAGEQLISILNGLHDFADADRRKILDGLGPAEVFNAIVAGEQDLYRLGTSSYREFLHPVVLAGLKQSGSFEAFLERATVTRFGDEAVRATPRRGLVFLRVASSFGLIDPVIESVRDRSRFIDDAIASLGDPTGFEGNSSVLMELLTAPSASRAVAGFKKQLLDRLYERYGAEQSPALKSVYGSMLSTYQTVSGDRRDRAIDQAYQLDTSIFNVPFARLFSPTSRNAYTHRMFMRMDQDTDAIASYGGFRLRMQMLGAHRRDAKTYEVFTIRSFGRTIEIYVNRPTADGNRRGIADIAAALNGRRIETIIGRGHTHIIAPMQADSKRIAGDRIKDVAVVLVGACGGDASVREMIGTFGYKPFFATKATGRAVINNAIIENYIAALRAMRPGDRLSMSDVLARSMSSFLRSRSDEQLRTDAGLYEANMTTVYTTYLFDAYVRNHVQPRRAVDR